MIFELFLSALACLFVWDYLNKKRRNDILNRYKIPGPATIPIIGNALDLMKYNTETMFEMSRKNKAKYGKIYRYWVLHQLSVIVMDVKYLEAIMNSQQLIKKSSLYDFLKSWLGTGLLLSTGKKWHTRRKIITPAFHFKILEEFVDIFDHHSSTMVEKLYKLADGKTEIDISPVVCLAALDTIAETAMGVKVNAQENPDFDYVKAVARVAEMMATRFITPTRRTDWLFLLTAPREYYQMFKSIKLMHNFTNKVIKERRETLQQSIADGTYQPIINNASEMGVKKRMALLDVLLQSTVNGSPLTNEDIREEVDTFMFEGHDTTTSGISFCLYLIARHPLVQQKLIAEIHQVIGQDKNKAICLRDLQDLKYLECTIKESLRMYPSVPGFGREVTEDIQIADIVLPAKTNVQLSIYMALRDPDYFPEPDVFRPERWAADSAEKINTFAYTPFSAGPRNCIGQKFAMLEMKSIISKTLRHFELLPLGPQVRPMINLILRSANGVHIGLKPRT